MPYKRLKTDPTILFTNTNWRGDVFTEYFVRKSHTEGHGFYIFGRNKERYGGNYIMLCARPNVKPRKCKHFNGLSQRGWKTRKEAQAIADMLNREFS